MEQEIQLFIEALTKLSGQIGEVFKTGNIALFTDINRSIKEMHRIQSGSEVPALLAVDDDCKLIYSNFDMLIAVLKTTENGEIDRGAQGAINKFLHNINEGIIRIASAFGLI